MYKIECPNNCKKITGNNLRVLNIDITKYLTQDELNVIHNKNLTIQWCDNCTYINPLLDNLPIFVSELWKDIIKYQVENIINPERLKNENKFNNL